MLDHGVMKRDTPRQELEALSVLWEQRWPTPAGGQMRHVHRDRWVRFHSLPGSKRYPDGEAEYAIVLERHHTLLSELGPSDDELYVVTREWNGYRKPVARMVQLREVDPEPQHRGIALGAALRERCVRAAVRYPGLDQQDPGPKRHASRLG